MRRLVVMRHARAAGASWGEADFDRMLEVRGRLEAREVGGGLATRGVIPDVVLCSEARRARETWDRMEGAFGRPIDVRYVGSFYERGAKAALEALALQPASIQTIFVIGHNPEWETLIQHLTGELVAMGTANAAIIAFANAEWGGTIEGGRGHLVEVVRPVS